MCPRAAEPDTSGMGGARSSSLSSNPGDFAVKANLRTTHKGEPWTKTRELSFHCSGALVLLTYGSELFAIWRGAQGNRAKWPAREIKGQRTSVVLFVAHLGQLLLLAAEEAKGRTAPDSCRRAPRKRTRTRTERDCHHETATGTTCRGAEWRDGPAQSQWF